MKEAKGASPEELKNLFIPKSQQNDKEVTYAETRAVAYGAANTSE